MKRVVSLPWVAVAVCVALAQTAFSQVTVETKPKSDHFITLRLTLPNTSPIEITVRDGTMARLKRQSDGATIGIAPRITDPNTGAVGVMILGISTLDDGNETAQAIETVRLNPSGNVTALTSEACWSGKAVRVGEAVSDSAPMLKEMTLIGVDVPFAHPVPKGVSAPSTASAGGVRPNLPNACCLDCDGWTACGCAVYCGGSSCCTARCCPAP